MQGYKPEATDADILWYGIDRSRRQKTGEARVPWGKYADVKDSLGGVPGTARDDARAREGDDRGPPRTGAGGGKHGCVPVVPR